MAAEEEAALLLAAAGDDPARLEALVARRTAGEPLAWVVGTTVFCGIRIAVDPGVYVPRVQTEALARRAAAALGKRGVAVDLCTGAGAIARVLGEVAPEATVIGTDVDPLAVACARRNGVDARLGHLDEPLPPALLGVVDVVTAVAPYVPTEALHLLPRDVRAFEPLHALDGGRGGLALICDLVARSTRWLQPGGTLLLELGGDQAAAVAGRMEAAGFTGVAVLRDGDGDDRGIEGRRSAGSLSAVGTSLGGWNGISGAGG